LGKNQIDLLWNLPDLSKLNNFSDLTSFREGLCTLLPDPQACARTQKGRQDARQTAHFPRSQFTPIHKEIPELNARRNNAEIRSPLVPFSFLIFDNHDLE
jgi:hypothetical protein